MYFVVVERVEYLDECVYGAHQMYACSVCLQFCLIRPNLLENNSYLCFRTSSLCL